MVTPLTSILMPGGGCPALPCGHSIHESLNLCGLTTAISTRLMAEARRQASEALSKSALVLPTSTVVAGNASEIEHIRGHFDPVGRWVTVKNVCAQYDVGTFTTHCSANKVHNQSWLCALVAQ